MFQRSCAADADKYVGLQQIVARFTTLYTQSRRNPIIALLLLKG